MLQQKSIWRPYWKIAAVKVFGLVILQTQKNQEGTPFNLFESHVVFSCSGVIWGQQWYSSLADVWQCFCQSRHGVTADSDIHLTQTGEAIVRLDSLRVTLLIFLRTRQKITQPARHLNCPSQNTTHNVCFPVSTRPLCGYRMISQNVQLPAKQVSSVKRCGETPNKYNRYHRNLNNFGPFYK